MDSDRMFVYPVTLANTPVPRAMVFGSRLDSDGTAMIILRPRTSENWMAVVEGCDFEAPGVLALGALPNVDDAEEAFLREKSFFESIPLRELIPYNGHYVAVHERRIADSDAELHALTNRFFSQHGDVPVYMAFVGRKPQELIPSPIF